MAHCAYCWAIYLYQQKRPDWHRNSLIANKYGSLCILLSYISISTKETRLAQKCFYSKWISLATTSLRVPVNCQAFFCPTLTTLGVSGQTFRNILNIKFHGNPSSGSRNDASGRTSMTKLMCPCRNYTNAPKGKRSVPSRNPEEGSLLSDGQ